MIEMANALKTESLVDERLSLLRPGERTQLKTFGNRIGVSVIM